VTAATIRRTGYGRPLQFSSSITATTSCNSKNNG
jgi:hypothetical protein